MKRVAKSGSLIPFEFTQRKKLTIVFLREAGLLGRGGGNSFKRAVTDDGSTMRDIFFFLTYQCSNRHAEEIDGSVAERTDIREANSGGCGGRALASDQRDGYMRNGEWKQGER